MERNELRKLLQSEALRWMTETTDPTRLAVILEGVRRFHPPLADAMPDAATLCGMSRDARRDVYLSALRRVGIAHHG
jgi:hypothetical protein